MGQFPTPAWPAPRTVSGHRLAALAVAMRPHQWLKNLIVFVPLLTSHQLARPRILLAGGLGFAAFSFCASAIYLLNDVADLEADRLHPTKSRRPLASGALPVAWAWICAPALLGIAFLIAAAVTPLFAGTLGVYAVLSLAYSWRLKLTPFLDTFVLAGLYTLRLIGGHTATGIAFSDWLLAFSMFVFLSLALVKRFQELRGCEGDPEQFIHGRGYRPDDLALLPSLGLASACTSVLVLALYVNSDQVRILYRRPMFLLLICPLFLYWLARVWLFAHRGKMHDDPVLFATRDAVSYLVAALTLALVWLAT